MSNNKIDPAKGPSTRSRSRSSHPPKGPIRPEPSGRAPMISADTASQAIVQCEASRRLKKISDLTPREREVLGHAALGCADQEIAGSMLITPRTVRHYFTTLFQKFGARNRIDVAMTGMLAHVANCEECFQALVAYRRAPAGPPPHARTAPSKPTTHTCTTPIPGATT